MSAASRQGSSSYVIVIAGLTFILVGAIVLTFVVFPFVNNFTAMPFFSAETGPGSNLTNVVAGLWEFWAFILMLMLAIYVWVATRQ